MMSKGVSVLVALANALPLVAAEPLTTRGIDGINHCCFVSDDVIAYTTSKGELRLCASNDLKTFRITSCSPAGAWICGADRDVLVVQSASSVIGYSSKSLEKLYEATTDHGILSTAISPKKQLIAIFDQAGEVTTLSLPYGKRLGSFTVGKPEYAQSWMGFDFTNQGDSLFFFLHSYRRKDNTVTRVVNTKTGKPTHSCSDWHSICPQSIEDATLLFQDESCLLLATRSKGVFQANTTTHKVKLLFTSRNVVYKVFSARIRKCGFAFVCCENRYLEIYDLASNQVQETLSLPKGYVRSYSFSQNRERLALVVCGEDGDNLVVVDLSFLKAH